MGNYQKSKRENRKQFKKEEEKFLRKLHNELERLWNARRSLGYIKLEKPVRKGYKKVLVLRDDIARSPVSQTWNALLKHLKKEIHHHDKRFVKKARRRSKKMVPITMLPLELHYHEWRKLSPEFQVYFSPVSNSRGILYYRFNDSWILREKIVPHYITHVRIHDGELEGRIAQLENYITRHDLEGRLQRLYYHGYQWKQRYLCESKGGRKKKFLLMQQEMREHALIEEAY